MKATNPIEAEILIKGINRFYSEGYSVWSKDKFDSLLKSSPNISEKAFVDHLVKQGNIRFIGKADEYIVVLKKIE